MCLLPRNPVETKIILPINTYNYDESPIYFQTKDTLTNNEDSDIDTTLDDKTDPDETPQLTEHIQDSESIDTENFDEYERLYSPRTPSNTNKKVIMVTENVSIARDSLQLRHDNVVIFTDLNGTPCDNGAKLLEQNNLIPNVKDLTLARAKITNFKNYKLIIIPIKENIANCTKIETVF
ncbi:hypothetical protein M0802_013041 [Mischocyttarus mexicanus]|nr:hypothetical protein M0802_013041 [Mischocyttarus mexicanus]